jgi:hypothetical protein
MSDPYRDPDPTSVITRLRQENQELRQRLNQRRMWVYRRKEELERENETLRHQLGECAMPGCAAERRVEHLEALVREQARIHRFMRLAFVAFAMTLPLLYLLLRIVGAVR